MVDGFIRVPPDGKGKKMRTTTTVVDSETVHQEVVQVVNASDAIINPSTETTLAKQLAFNAITTIMYVDEPDANTTYQGWAVGSTATSAANWMIRRVSKSGSITSILWADGDQLYNNIWDDRASLSYS